MSDDVLSPERCTSMAEVRKGVDETDRLLFALLKERFGYMRAAARIKAERDDVRDEARKAAVIDAIRLQAADAGLPEQELASIWDALVETSIDYEMKEWDRLHG